MYLSSVQEVWGSQMTDKRLSNPLCIDNSVAVDVTRVKGEDYHVKKEEHLGSTVRWVRNRVNREIICDQ